MSFCLLCCWCCCYCFFFSLLPLSIAGAKRSVLTTYQVNLTQSKRKAQRWSKSVCTLPLTQTSLFITCAQRKAGRRQRARRRFACRLYPSHGPLRFITSHSFRACLCHAKNEAPEEEAGLDLRSLSPALPNLRSGNFYYYYYYYYYSCRLTVLLFSNFGARCFREIYHENHV